MTLFTHTDHPGSALRIVRGTSDGMLALCRVEHSLTPGWVGEEVWLRRLQLRVLKRSQLSWIQSGGRLAREME